MAGKVIVLLDWALELNLSNDEKLEIQTGLADARRHQSEPRELVSAG
jgi:hypothetical protein